MSLLKQPHENELSETLKNDLENKKYLKLYELAKTFGKTEYELLGQMKTIVNVGGIKNKNGEPSSTCAADCKQKEVQCHDHCPVQTFNCHLHCNNLKSTDCHEHCGFIQSTTCHDHCNNTSTLICHPHCQGIATLLCHTHCKSEKSQECHDHCTGNKSEECHDHCKGHRSKECHDHCDLEPSPQCHIHCKRLRGIECHDHCEDLISTECHAHCRKSTGYTCHEHCDRSVPVEKHQHHPDYQKYLFKATPIALSNQTINQPNTSKTQPITSSSQRIKSIKQSNTSNTQSSTSSTSILQEHSFKLKTPIKSINNENTNQLSPTLDLNTSLKTAQDHRNTINNIMNRMDDIGSSPIASPKAFSQQNDISNNRNHEIENIESSPLESSINFQMEIDSVHSELHEVESIPNAIIVFSNTLTDIPNTSLSMQNTLPNLQNRITISSNSLEDADNTVKDTAFSVLFKLRKQAGISNIETVDLNNLTYEERFKSGLSVPFTELRERRNRESLTKLQAEELSNTEVPGVTNDATPLVERIYDFSMKYNVALKIKHGSPKTKTFICLCGTYRKRKNNNSYITNCPYEFTFRYKNGFWKHDPEKAKLKHNESCTSNILHKGYITNVVEKYESLLEPLVTRDEKPFVVCANIMRVLREQLGPAFADEIDGMKEIIDERVRTCQVRLFTMHEISNLSSESFRRVCQVHLESCYSVIYSVGERGDTKKIGIKNIFVIYLPAVNFFLQSKLTMIGIDTTYKTATHLRSRACNLGALTRKNKAFAMITGYLVDETAESYEELFQAFFFILRNPKLKVFCLSDIMNKHTNDELCDYEGMPVKVLSIDHCNALISASKKFSVFHMFKTPDMESILKQHLGYSLNEEDEENLKFMNIDIEGLPVELKAYILIKICSWHCSVNLLSNVSPRFSVKKSVYKLLDKVQFEDPEDDQKTSTVTTEIAKDDVVSVINDTQDMDESNIDLELLVGQEAGETEHTGQDNGGLLDDSFIKQGLNEVFENHENENENENEEEDDDYDDYDSSSDDSDQDEAPLIFKNSIDVGEITDGSMRATNVAEEMSADMIDLIALNKKYCSFIPDEDEDTAAADGDNENVNDNECLDENQNSYIDPQVLAFNRMKSIGEGKNDMDNILSNLCGEKLEFDSNTVLNETHWFTGTAFGYLALFEEKLHEVFIKVFGTGNVSFGIFNIKFYRFMNTSRLEEGLDLMLAIFWCLINHKNGEAIYKYLKKGLFHPTEMFLHSFFLGNLKKLYALNENGDCNIKYKKSLKINKNKYFVITYHHKTHVSSFQESINAALKKEMKNRSLLNVMIHFNNKSANLLRKAIPPTANIVRYVHSNPSNLDNKLYANLNDGMKCILTKDAMLKLMSIVQEAISIIRHQYLLIFYNESSWKKKYPSIHKGRSTIFEVIKQEQRMECNQLCHVSGFPCVHSLIVNNIGLYHADVTKKNHVMKFRCEEPIDRSTIHESNYYDYDLTKVSLTSVKVLPLDETQLNECLLSVIDADYLPQSNMLGRMKKKQIWKRNESKVKKIIDITNQHNKHIANPDQTGHFKYKGKKRGEKRSRVDHRGHKMFKKKKQTQNNAQELLVDNETC